METSEMGTDLTVSSDFWSIFFKSNERKFGDFHHEIYFSTNTLKIVGFMI